MKFGLTVTIRVCPVRRLIRAIVPPLEPSPEPDDQIRSEAQRIHQQTVVLKAMPIGNLTQISEEERNYIDAWYQGRVHQE